MKPYDEISTYTASSLRSKYAIAKIRIGVFTFGNVSAVDRSLGVFAIKPSGVPYEELSPDKMVIVDFDGNVLKENCVLLPIQKLMQFCINIGKRLAALSHTHSTYATAWAQAQRDIPIFGTTHADHNTVDIPCAAANER